MICIKNIMTCIILFIVRNTVYIILSINIFGEIFMEQFGISDDIKYIKLGESIAYYRRLRNLTQENLAERLDISRSHMSGIEVAKHRPSLDLIFRICRTLKIDEKTLFDFDAIKELTNID